MDVHDLLLREQGTSTSSLGEFVFVRDVTISAKIGPDAWGRSKIQPVTVSAQIPFSVAKAGVEDSIVHTLDYRKVYKIIRSFDTSETDTNARVFDSLINLAEQVGQNLWTFATWVRLDLTAPKGLLQSDALVLRYYSINWRALRPGPNDFGIPLSTLSVRSMHVPCIIGIGEHERIRKQPVIVDFAVFVSDYLTIERPIPELFDQTFKVSGTMVALA
jgi:dihydroneopterin aldolase